MTDPLAQFRRKSPATPEPAKPSGGAGERVPYSAFETKDRVKALDIRRADGVGHSPSYSYLLDLSYGRREYKSFVLVFSFMVVHVRGRNLRAVVDSLKLRACEFIAEYSAEEFDPPAADEPVIESIQVTVKDPSAVVAETSSTTAKVR